MQPNTTALAKRSIKAALKANWTEAIELNLLIVDKNPKDIDAKLRLARAYCQTKQVQKAKKEYKEVLLIDPINQVAKKNLEMLNNKQVELHEGSEVNTKELIKEPGTTTEIRLNIDAKGLTAGKFTSGEKLELKVNKKSIGFYKINHHKLLIGNYVTQNLVSIANSEKAKKAEFEAYFIKGEDKVINVLIKATIPLFKSEKQDVRPYLKKGSIPDADMEDEEEEETVTTED